MLQSTCSFFFFSTKTHTNIAVAFFFFKFCTLKSTKHHKHCQPSSSFIAWQHKWMLATPAFLEAWSFLDVTAHTDRLKKKKKMSTLSWLRLKTLFFFLLLLSRRWTVYIYVPFFFCSIVFMCHFRNKVFKNDLTALSVGASQQRFQMCLP